MPKTLRLLMERLRSQDRGASLVEYALLMALIVFVCIGAVTFFGNGSGNSLDHSKDCINAAQGGVAIPADCEEPLGRRPPARPPGPQPSRTMPIRTAWSTAWVRSRASSFW